jgi:hypothetical protein
VLGLAGIATLLVAAWLLLRWRLVVQACVFDRRDGRDAFREAAILSRGVRWGLAGRCLAVVGLLLALLLAAAGLQQAAVVRNARSVRNQRSVVDGLITNEPAKALRHVRDFEALSQSERTLRRVHAWLAD